LGRSKQALDRSKRIGIAVNVLDAERALPQHRASKATYDVITCFSAYMLGACGPTSGCCRRRRRLARSQTWPTSTLTSGTTIGRIGNSSCPFAASVARQDRFGLAGATAYFCGMATHVAADVVVHQLVNVSAGAYNLLEKLKKVFPDKTWQNEKWSGLGKNIWNTHNKVEHYWTPTCAIATLETSRPSGRIALRTRRTGFRNWLPTVDGLMDYARRNYMEGSAVVEDCKSALNEPLVKYAVGKAIDVSPSLLRPSIGTRQGGSALHIRHSGSPGFRGLSVQ